MNDSSRIGHFSLACASCGWLMHCHRQVLAVRLAINWFGLARLWARIIELHAVAVQRLSSLQNWASSLKKPTSADTGWS